MSAETPSPESPSSNPETEIEWEVLEEISGDIQAEIMRGLLEAQGIQILLSQEGIGRFAYSVGIGPLGNVQILVPSNQMAAAQAILADYYAGNFDTEALGVDPVDLPPGMETEGDEETAGDNAEAAAAEEA